MAGRSAALCFFSQSANICRPCGRDVGRGQAADFQAAEQAAHLRRQVCRAARDRLAHGDVADGARQRQPLRAGEEPAAQVFRLAALGFDGRRSSRWGRSPSPDRAYRRSRRRPWRSSPRRAQRQRDVGIADLQRGVELAAHHLLPGQLGLDARLERVGADAGAIEHLRELLPREIPCRFAMFSKAPSISASSISNP